MILVMFILTPFTTSPCLSLFFHFRVAQCRLMILAVVHGLTSNPKLRSILEGCANLRSVWSSDFDSHRRFSETFFQPDAVYVRFTHFPISNRNSTLARHPMEFFIGNTAGFGNSCNFKTIDWCRLSFLFGTGKITTTSSFGVQSRCSRDEMISVRWSWPLFKNGNRS